LISFQFPNTQGGLDESFGIDNIVVSTDNVDNTVPEPASLALVLAALVGAGFSRRR
jgi:PEP-CTERM motif